MSFPNWERVHDASPFQIIPREARKIHAMRGGTI